MHPPFVAMTWPAGDAPSRAPPASLAVAFRANGWTLAGCRQGLALWERPDRPLAVGDGPDHLLIGRWIGDPRRRQEAAGSLGGGVAAGARALCRDGWGAYLALIREADGRWWAFRDPSGAVEALTWTSGGCRLVASGLAGLPAGLLPDRLALDWATIADQLRQPIAQAARSGLRGVCPIAPGDLQPLGATAEAAVAIWRPTDFLPSGPEVDASWPERLAETIQTVVNRLLEPYDRFASEASGGLDSSIVHAAAAQAGSTARLVAALHYVGDRPEADERRWVELLGRQYALPLVCLPLATGSIDPDADFALLARDARPPFAAIDPERDRDTARALESCGAQALLTGKGGDAVFFQMPSAAVLADLWAAGGLAAGRHPRHAEVAHWTRRSVWSLWLEGLARPPARPAAGALGSLAGPGLAALASGVPHPWLVDLDGAPPGKRLQIEALANSQLALGPHRRGQVADLVQPLLSQPVMELCLSIPTWELVRGGRDRGLAREAFSPWLPEAITNRRSKGNLTSHYARRTAASADILREHLLDGVLVDAGLLDREATEAALQPDALIWRADGIDLIGVAAVESWVRYWQTRAPDAPEARRPGQAPWA